MSRCNLNYLTLKNPLQISQRRKHYRLVYPVGYGPKLFINGRQFNVMDISESGIRFDNPNLIHIPEDLVVAVIQLKHDRGHIKIVGRINRRQHTQVVLQLILGVPYNEILLEQIFLRKVQKNI